MTEAFCSPSGDDANPGTQALPKLDPSKATGFDALWLEGNGEYRPAGRIMAAKMIGAYGAGALPRIVSHEIAISLINCTGTTVQDLDISGEGCTRGIHAGVANDDPLAVRDITLQRLYIHDLLGDGAVGIQSWGQAIKVRRVRVQRTRSDSWWHKGADIDAEQVTLLEPSCLGEGTGDNLQAYVSRSVHLIGLTLDHYTHDKQALLISGQGELESCEIVGLTVAGWAVGAGLVTFQNVRRVAGRHWNLNMPQGPANAGIAWIENSEGYIHDGVLLGYEGAWAALNSDTSNGRMSGFERAGWKAGGITEH